MAETNPTHAVYNLIILDESGSMQSIKQPIINGFNEVIQAVKHAQQTFQEQQHNITFITFNGAGLKTLLNVAPVDTIAELDMGRYQPDHMTPLYDAIGNGISIVRKAIQEADNDYTVLVTILTDGEENASTEYRHAQVKSLIEELKEKNWAFTYIGANHDVERVAMNFSIDASIDFMACADDVDRVMDVEKKSRISFFEKRVGGVSVKEAAASYFTVRKLEYKDEEVHDGQNQAKFSLDEDF